MSSLLMRAGNSKTARNRTASAIRISKRSSRHSVSSKRSTTLEEIREAEFNLNIPRYVDTFEEEEDIDIPAVQEEIQAIEAELARTQKELNKYLEDLGF